MSAPYTRNEKPGRNFSTAFYEYLPANPTDDEIRAAFGEPCWSDYEEEKGYRYRYTFVGPDGKIGTLYDKCFNWRVGFECDFRTGFLPGGDEFLAWVNAKLAEVKAVATVGA